MLGAGFAAGSVTGPVVSVLVIVVVLALVIAAVVFLGPIERFANRVMRRRARAVDRPATPTDAGVLWVDDRPEHNARLLNGLRDQGVRVDVTRTTAEALEHLGQGDYAIVVSDLSRVDRPDDGVRLLEQASGTTPVVIFSRYASVVDAYRGGAFAVVSSEAGLRDCLRSVNLLP
jgi:CheY-like chemotaxis protein